MPQIFRVAGYLVYFWSNENEPLEPVHVHITDGVPAANATKVWITKSGKCLLANNNSKIPERMLRDIMSVDEVDYSTSTVKHITFKKFLFMDDLDS